MDRSNNHPPLRWIDRLSELAGYISGLLLLVSTLVICEAVVVRYVLGAPTVWQTELSIYLLMFAAFVGGAYGLKHGDHVNVDIVVNRFSERGRLVARLSAAILGLAFVATVAYIAFGLWWHATETGMRSGTAWNPPMTYPYFIVPLGMTLISLQYLSIIVQTIGQLRSGRVEEHKAGDPQKADEGMEGGLNQ